MAAEIGAVPCCEGNDQCCYEHKEDDQTSPLLAELNRQNRVDPTEGLQSVSQLLPAPVTLVVRSYHAIRDTEPIKTQVLERSLHQSWLI